MRISTTDSVIISRACPTECVKKIKAYTALREAVEWYFECRELWEYSEVGLKGYVGVAADEIYKTYEAAEQRLCEMCSNGGENP